MIERKRPENPDLSRFSSNVTVLYDNSEDSKNLPNERRNKVYLVPTVKINLFRQASCARQVIAYIRPDAVALELCEKRLFELSRQFGNLQNASLKAKKARSDAKENEIYDDDLM